MQEDFLKEINNSVKEILDRKEKRLNRFSQGDIVYPLFWQSGMNTQIWGTVVEVVPEIGKVKVSIADGTHLFSPDELLPVNPELSKKRSAIEQNQKHSVRVASDLQQFFRKMKKCSV